MTCMTLPSFLLANLQDPGQAYTDGRQDHEQKLQWQPGWGIFQT